MQYTTAEDVDRLRGTNVCTSGQGDILGAVQGTYCGGKDPVTGESVHTFEIGIGVAPTDLFPPLAFVPVYAELDLVRTRVQDIPFITPWAGYYLNEPATKK